MAVVANSNPEDRGVVVNVQEGQMISYARSLAAFRHVRHEFSTRGRINRVCVLAATIAALWSFFPLLFATAVDSFRYRGGLRNSPGEHKLNQKQIDALLTSLRDKTGFLEMRFDENGFLTLGDQTKFSGGSSVARALITAAVKMASAVDLESHPFSSHVAFARLARPIAYLHFSSGKKIDVFPLEIDFSDLSKLRGDQQALAAFDLGFMILHELGHAALGLRDTAGDPQGLGECEELINRIRRELNLPERQTYVAQIHSSPSFNPTHGPNRLAELVFARTVEKKGRMQNEKFSVRWEASKVGPITETPLQSITKDRNSKPITATASGQ